MIIARLVALFAVLTTSYSSFANCAGNLRNPNWPGKTKAVTATHNDWMQYVFSNYKVEFNASGVVEISENELKIEREGKPEVRIPLGELIMTMDETYPAVRVFSFSVKLEEGLLKGSYREGSLGGGYFNYVVGSKEELSAKDAADYYLDHAAVGLATVSAKEAIGAIERRDNASFWEIVFKRWKIEKSKVRSLSVFNYKKSPVNRHPLLFVVKMKPHQGPDAAFFSTLNGMTNKADSFEQEAGFPSSQINIPSSAPSTFQFLEEAFSDEDFKLDLLQKPAYEIKF